MTNTGILDFLTISTEFCALVEQAEKQKKKDFVNTLHKLMSLLYVRATLLPATDDVDGYCETYVTEEDWDFVQNSVATKLGELDTFLSIVEPDNYDNGQEVSVSISECVADIYQDIRDFIERYRNGNDETQFVAIYECDLNFKLYWGPRLLAALEELHGIVYSSSTELEDEE